MRFGTADDNRGQSARGDRLSVASRAVAGIAGGYVAAALLATMLGTILPMRPDGAAIVATLIALLAMPVAAMACFWARSAARAWAGTLIACAGFAAVALAAGWRP